MSNAELDKAIEQLRIEYVGNSVDRVNSMDLLLDKLIRDKGNREELFVELQRDIHSLKGSASTFGFPLVSTIAHRLEDYIEASERLGLEQWNDVQKYFDAIRDLFEKASEPQGEDAEALLEQLPRYSSLSSEQEAGPAGIVLLVMPKGTQRKIVSKEFLSRGYELAFADTGIQGIDQATSLNPSLVLLTQELDKFTGLEVAQMLAVRKQQKETGFILLTSSNIPQTEIFPANMMIIKKGKNFGAELDRVLGVMAR